MSQIQQSILYWSGLVYLIAFLSLYHQLPGLYSANGILPVDDLISFNPKNPIFQSLTENPNLLILFKYFGFSTFESLEISCLAGILISIGTVLHSGNTKLKLVPFILLYGLYFSCYSVGQTFLHFQWDIMLLEFGIQCIILTISDRQGLFITRWLLVRLMFHSGYKKLESGCPTWWGLTALNWHFESQCIPTPLAYYAHHLPNIFLKYGVAITFVAQIGVTLFALSPNRKLRILCGWTHILHQTGIAVTGNYNFFNLLTMVLCLACFDDLHYDWLMIPFRMKTKKSPKIKITKPEESKMSKMINLGNLVLQFIQVVGLLYLVSNAVWVDKDDLNIFLLDTEEDMSALRWARLNLLKPIIAMAILWLAYSILRDVWDGELFKIVTVPFTAFVFTCSLVPFTDIDRSIGWPQMIHQISNIGRQYNVASSYGLFRRMTGVGGRPEVVIELGTTDGKFQEVDFLYKPTDLNVACPWVAPHQPRLDWQMWFAALGNANHNPWLINFGIRLLQAEPTVLKLIGENKFKRKFETEHPSFLRMYHYTYHYTEDRNDGIWSRDNKKEYLMTLDLNHDGVKDYIKRNNLELKKLERKETQFHNLLRIIRNQSDKFNAETVILSILFLLFSNKLM